MYMADSLDYHTGRSEPADPKFRAGVFSAGLWITPYQEVADNPAALLGARHEGKAKVLYADGHVTREGQRPRNVRDGKVIASTFADYVEERSIGTQHHIMPCRRKVVAAGY
jgi:prepilin-type processing-associated H-X9-DG protein